MSLKDFHLKWVQGISQRAPMFLSSSDILILYESFIKLCRITNENTCNLVGKNSCTKNFPFIQIDCITTMPELGILAVSERRSVPVIYIFTVPDMEVHIKLEDHDKDKFVSLKFIGLEFLLSISMKNSTYIINLWNWNFGYLIPNVSVTYLNSEPQIEKLLSSPFSWYLFTFQLNNTLNVMEIQYSNRAFEIDANQFNFIHTSEDGYHSICTNSHSDENDDLGGANCLELYCHCWLPDNNILLATSSGLIKLSVNSGKKTDLIKMLDSEPNLSSMVVNRVGLLLGYESGLLQIIDISTDEWSISKIMKVKHPIKEIISSPDFQNVIVKTDKSAAFLQHETDSQSFSNLETADLKDVVGIVSIDITCDLFLVVLLKGFLHVLKFKDGKNLSNIYIEDTLTCVASSPVCSFVAVGACSGFVHLVDITTPGSLRIIHSLKSFETRVEKIKIDNFGRYLVSAAKMEGINIWSALPTENFLFLGSMKIDQAVNDIALYTDTRKESTMLLILSETGLCSEKGAGNIVLRLLLPLDFNTRATNLHVDNLQTLNTQDFSCVKIRLNYPCYNIAMQEKYGMILYSPITEIVYGLWPDTSSRQIDLIKVSDLLCLRLSSNQQWLAIVDTKGDVKIFSCQNMKLVASATILIQSSNIFLEFAHFRNCLLVASDDGCIMMFEWADEYPILPNIPESLMYCMLNFEKQNTCLRELNEEGDVSVVLKGEENEGMSCMRHKTCITFSMWVDILNFRLNQITQINHIESENDRKTSYLYSDSRYMEKLSELNDMLILKCFSNDQQLFERETEIKYSNKCAQIMTSTNLGFTVSDYSIIQQLPGELLEKINSKINQVKDFKISTSDLYFFKKGASLKPKVEVWPLLKKVRTRICDTKLKFNELFKKHFENQKTVAERMSQLSSEIRLATESLPSKAEKDLWAALSSSRSADYDTDELSSSASSEIMHAGLSEEVDAVAEIKRKVDYLKETKNNIQVIFDSNVEQLFHTKLFCDHEIYKSELKVFCILLIILVDEKVQSCRTELQKQISISENFEVEIAKTVDETKNFENYFLSLYKKVQISEREINAKLKTKCQKLGDVSRNLYSYHPQYKHECKPLWSHFPVLTTDYFSSDEFKVPIACPEGIDGRKWLKLRSKKSSAVKMNIILNHVQGQCLDLTGIRMTMEELRQTLTTASRKRTEMVQKVNLVSTKVAEKLTTIFLQNLGSESCQLYAWNFKELPRSGHPFWKDVKANAGNYKRLQNEMENVESMFEEFGKIMNKRISKFEQKIEQYTSMMEDFRTKLEEKKKQLEEDKVVVEEICKPHGWNILKIFNSL